MKKLKGTVVFVVLSNKVLFAKKTRVLGIGKWNGYGGNMEPEDATIEDCAVREFKEESGGATIKKEDLEWMGCITFHRADLFEFEVDIYIAKAMEGNPINTDEMVEPTWFDVNNLPPADEFMESDSQWVPRILSGEKLVGDVWYDKDFNLTERGVELKEVAN